MNNKLGEKQYTYAYIREQIVITTTENKQKVNDIKTDSTKNGKR